VWPSRRPPSKPQRLGGSISTWRDKYPQVEVDEVVSRQDAAHALLEASLAARLLVVGSSGLGSLTGTVLGSVGLHLLHHAGCPVMIARH
jgi:nucleotide-binding universal stress UspA family protein